MDRTTGGRVTAAEAHSTGTADVVPYPDELAASYRQAGYWRPQTIPTAFHQTALAHPDRCAVVGTDGELSYRELDRQSDLVALGLSELGLLPGERILLQLTNCRATVVAWYGLLKAGLIPICTLPHHRMHELSQISAQAEPAAHLVQGDFQSQDLLGLALELRDTQPCLREVLSIAATERPGTVALESMAEAEGRAGEARQLVERVAAQVNPESVGVLQLSGGTTSLPKLIPRLHVEYWYNAARWGCLVEMDESACVAHLLPLIHNAGIACALHAVHSVGGSVAVCPPDRESLLALARQHPITHILLVRAVAQLIIDTPEVDEDLSSLRIAVWADKRLTPDIHARFDTDTCRLGQMFGMGEGMCMLTPLDASEEVRYRTNGAPLSLGDEVRVLRPHTEETVPRGEPGELCCRGPYTIRGYFRAPERNLEAFTSDGFYRTGDIVVEVEHEGRSYFSLQDRLKDLINRGGEKVNAAEVEGLLLRHPGIRLAALVGMPDERLGERACAFIVPADQARVPTLDEIKQWFDELGVAKYKWPERLEIRDVLPLTSIEKINKVALREQINQIIEAEGQ